MSRLLDAEPPHVLGHLLWLWLRCLEHAGDGDIGDWDAERVAHYASYRGDAGAFLEAMVASGWIERENGTLRLDPEHWEEATSKLVQLRQAAAERKRRQRERQRQRLAENNVTRDKRDMSQARCDKRDVTHERNGTERKGKEKKKGSAVAASGDTVRAEGRKQMHRRLLARYRERSGRRVTVFGGQAERYADDLVRRGATEQDLLDAIDGMIAAPHRSDTGKAYNQLHHAWTARMYETHRERGERMRTGQPADDPEVSDADRFGARVAAIRARAGRSGPEEGEG